jgi:hypothetical protein
MTIPSGTALRAQSLHDSLEAQARAAKRAEAASRRQAREIRRSMAELRAACRELGITITETRRSG